MLDFSISKLAVLALLALLVLGPEKLPKVAAQLGRWVGRARVMARNLRSQLEQEVSYDELLKEKQKAEAALKAARDSSIAQGAQISQSMHENPNASSPAAPAPAGNAADQHISNPDGTTDVGPPQSPRA